MKNLIKQNAYYFVAFIILLIAGGIILSCFTKAEFTLWVNARYNWFFDRIFLLSSGIGNILFSLSVLLVLWFWKGWKISLQAFSCIFATALVVQMLKHIVFPGSPRPVLYFDGIEDLRLLGGVVQLQTESFPSGHTAAAFALATFFALMLPKKQYHWMLALLAACVGYARIYLSQHFITDVYTGMIIGVVITTVVYYYASMALKIPK